MAKASKTAVERSAPEPPANAQAAPRNGRKPAIPASELVPLERLRPHPQNYCQHPEDQLVHLVQSIKANGLYRNVVVAKDWTILAGHGVVEAARRAGLEQVPVVRLNLAPTSTAALKVLAGDNEIGRLRDTDDRALTEILRQIKEDDGVVGLLGTGYDDVMLAGLVMVTRPVAEIKDFNAAAEWVGMPEFDPGTPSYTISIVFRTEKERDDYIAKNGMAEIKFRKFRNGQIMTTAWPPGTEATRSLVEFVEDEDDGEDATEISGVHPVEGKASESSDDQAVPKKRGRVQGRRRTARA